ncbi:uncharacterized protein MONOS_18560 [Monocercomonoides exilis]|uniref:uncharacterized protein n=1 Tax=Monocercomonoides exilis TaxID=2049356 RepID=UPI00355AB879|nr:hypothetical protein MONOS_18560 [Monocercomonoides exilis]
MRISARAKFNKLFCELEHCIEEDQKQKVLEINGLMEGIDREEFKFIFTTRMFEEMDKMIEKKKLSMENTILLLKKAGYCKVLKHTFVLGFEDSFLGNRFTTTMIDENEKKKGKDEKQLTDCCECYLLLSNDYISSLLPICVLSLLNAALKKEENEEVQKEVEIALLALSNIKFTA